MLYQNVDAALSNIFPPFCAETLHHITSSQGRHLYAARPATPMYEYPAAAQGQT